tara:strand:+ start:3606 stop:3779 length:174 start_codon:yes stop_codon:yes gene_type:complete
MNKRALSARRNAAELSALEYLCSQQRKRDQMRVACYEIAGALVMIPALFSLVFIIPK